MAESVIAVAAAPNTGKSTLFNRLTGSNQSVGNWPGVTVERRTGRLQLGGHPVRLVDLPGAYSLTPTSPEERIVQEYLFTSPPHLILNVVDAMHLYQGLGLTLQLASTGLPLVVAVNMMDEARAQGLKLDFDRLSSHLGVPVVPVAARTGEGLAELKAAMVDALEGRSRRHPPHIGFPPALEQVLEDLAAKVEERARGARFHPAFLARRLLEGSEAGKLFVRDHPELAEPAREAGERRAVLEKTLGAELSDVFAQFRYGAARGLVREAMRGRFPTAMSHAKGLDRVLLHRWLGLPIFVLAMLGMFQGVFALGSPLQGWIASGVELLQGWLGGLPVVAGLPPPVRSFLVDGLVAGVGVVLSFLPIVGLFFVFLSLIEDSGYIARAAFLMDRVMHVLRLDGKAFISILLGYGCNVPAVMGTRILPSRAQRIRTLFLIPFSLCSARLQVFLFLAAILFGARTAPWVVFGLYLASFGVILAVGLALRPFGERNTEPFIMELPPYRWPMLRSVALRVIWEVESFLRRAATLIVVGVVAVWFLTHFPSGTAPGSAATLAGRMGGFFWPVFHPLGIEMEGTVALIFGLIAKEIVIGALAVVYGTKDVAASVAAHVTPLQGLSFMVFTLIYTPCMGTIAAIRAESRSWSITLAVVVLGLVLAWLASFAVYQGGLLLGFA